MSNHYKPTRTFGFTLIELIVAIAVLAILVTMAIPAIQEMIKNNRVMGQGNELTAMLTFARNEAIRRNESVTIQMRDDTGSGWSGEVLDPAGPGADPCTEVGALRCASHTNVDFAELGKDGGDSLTLNFNNRGYLDPFGEPTLIALEHHDCSGNRQRRIITIRPTGQISSCTVACGATTC